MSDILPTVRLMPIPPAKNPFLGNKNPILLTVNTKTNPTLPILNISLNPTEGTPFYCYTYVSPYNIMVADYLLNISYFCGRVGYDLGKIAYKHGISECPFSSTHTNQALPDTIAAVHITGPTPTAILDGPGDQIYSAEQKMAIYLDDHQMGFNFLKSVDDNQFIQLNSSALLHAYHGKNIIYWNPDEAFPPTKNFTVWYDAQVPSKPTALEVFGPDWSEIKDPYYQLLPGAQFTEIGKSPIITRQKQPLPIKGNSIALLDLVTIDPQTQSGDSRLSTQWWVVVADDGPGSKRFLDLSVEPYRFATGKIYLGDVLSTITIPRRQLEAATPGRPLTIWAYNAKTPVPGVYRLTKDQLP